MYCSAEELKTEAWEEWKKAHNHDEEALKDEMLYCWFLDPDIQREQEIAAMTTLGPTYIPGPGVPKNTDAEPLFVAYLNTWRLRPHAFTGISNLLLASAYVRTFTSVATMEAANEAARRAVNAIIQHSGYKAHLCRLWNVTEPPFAFLFRLEDQYRYERGLPWKRPSFMAKQATKLAMTALPVANKVRKLVPGIN